MGNDEAARGGRRTVADPGVLGRNVARLRAARGWSQSELARRSGASQNFISALEGGARQSARVETVQALARALGVTVDELVREPEGVPAQEED